MERGIAPIARDLDAGGNNRVRLRTDCGGEVGCPHLLHLQGWDHDEGGFEKTRREIGAWQTFPGDAKAADVGSWSAVARVYFRWRDGGCDDSVLPYFLLFGFLCRNFNAVFFLSFIVPLQIPSSLVQFPSFIHKSLFLFYLFSSIAFLLF